MFILNWVYDRLGELQGYIPPENFPIVVGVVIAFTVLLLNSHLVIAALINARTRQPKQQRKLNSIDELEIKLLDLCQGNKELARRLYRYTKGRYPGRDKKWYLEKTIGDLQRDRRY